MVGRGLESTLTFNDIYVELSENDAPVAQEDDVQNQCESEGFIPARGECIDDIRFFLTP